MIQSLKPHTRRKDILLGLILGFIFGAEATILIGFFLDPDKYLK